MERLWNGNYIKVWIANFMLNFSFMILTPLLPLYMSDTFSANRHTIGIVLSGYTVTALLARSVSGYLVDSYPRKTVLLICFALFSSMFAGYFFTAYSLIVFALWRTLHGAPFGATTVANSTMAIDVLPSSRRAEGIGYYGLSNNLAMAIGPTIGLYIYEHTSSYNLIFLLALFTGVMGFIINATLRVRERETTVRKQKLSLDRFFLLSAWRLALSMTCFSFSYGILSTYLAIYGKEQLGILGGTGLFFMLLSAGLIMSRLVGSRTLRNGKIVHNATIGVTISVFGYALFASVHSLWAYYASALIIGLGNGHMFPAFQNLFIQMAPASQRGTANSTLLTSWDLGVGLGILIGGAVSGATSYGVSFHVAWIVNLAGVIFFYIWKKNM